MKKRTENLVLIPRNFFKEPERMSMAQMEKIMKKRGYDPRRADLSAVVREMAKKLKN